MRLYKKLLMQLRRPPISRPTKLEWVQVESGPLKGHFLLLDIGSVPWQLEMKQGLYEAFVQSYVSRWDLTAQVVWDVGAHVGYHAMAFAESVGAQGKVFAFEPHPENYRRFKINLEQNPELAEIITPCPFALSDCDGESSFVVGSHVDNGTSSGSRLDQSLSREDWATHRTLPRITVQTFSADTLVETQVLPPPSLIKLDVEGAECTVLQGATRLLHTAKPKLIIEVHSIEVMLGLCQLLCSFNYEIELLKEGVTSNSRCHVVAFTRGEP